MCDPVSLTIAAVMAVGSIAGNIAGNRAADAQEDAINAQGEIRSEEIADATGADIDERARAARRERAAARVAASESGISLGSNSFLAMLQASEIDQSIDSGLMLKNQRNQQRANTAEVKSSLAGIQKKTGLGIALDAGIAGVSGYKAAGGKLYMGRQPGRG
jgi:hypothetical protein